MKLYIKSIIAFAALLLTTNAWADKQFTYFYQLDGAQSSADAAGTVVGNISGTTATLTVTPKEGNYFENTDGSITVHKTLNGQYAQAREKAPGYDTPVALTVSGTPDPTGETVFTFEVTDEKYDYEVTVNFKSKISIANASITLAQTSYTYTGETIEPSITTVKLTDGTTLASTDYTVAFENNINVPATANDPQPTITVTGVGKYTGTASTTFIINKTAGSINYATATVNKTYGDEAFTNELTNTGDGTVEYTSNNESTATVDANGKVTIMGEGEATITATVTDGTNYTYATKTASYLVSVGTAAMEVTADGYTGTYDEKAHGITVNAPDGATIAYSKDGINYDLNASPTYTDAGTYTVFYQVTKANFTTITSSATVTINKAAGSISYATATVNKTYGDEAFTNELTNTGDGTISYESNNLDAATVDDKGEVTIVGDGEATITATVTDGTNYTYATKTASYLVSVGTAAMEVTADGYTGTYDEKAHGITVNAPDGATIAYSKNGTNYDLNASPTYTNAGTYTVFYQVTKANFTTITSSATVTINKAAGSINYATATVNKTYGDEAFTNELTNTGDGTVEYTSNNESAATVDANGKVTIVGDGEATITATVTDGTNFTYATKTASYKLIVSKRQVEGYALWIGDIQVKEDNAEDILGDGQKAFVFNPQTNTLFITDNQDESINIESRLPELNIYLNGEVGNKLKAIFYNNLGNAENKGNLYFTAFNNTQVPSTMVIENTVGESAIYGFEKVEYDQGTKVIILDPDNTEYKNGQIYYTTKNDDGTTTETIANKLTIGQALAVMDQTVTFTLRTLQLTDKDGKPLYEDDGTPKLPDLENSIVMDVLITLPSSNDSSTDEGIDSGDVDGIPGIAIETVTMTDAIVKNVAKRVRSTGEDKLVPGGDSFAQEYVGLTILLPAAEGSVMTDLALEPGYEFHMLIAEDDNSEPIVVPEGEILTPFDVKETTYCYIYLVKTSATARPISPIGKRDTAHGKVVSIGVKVVKSAGSNPPSEASGGVLPESEDPQLNIEAVTGIKAFIHDENVGNDKWYNLNGQQINEPTKQGLYIHNRKKVYVK